LYEPEIGVPDATTLCSTVISDFEDALATVIEVADTPSISLSSLIS
jgi:hypothetical protein